MADLDALQALADLVGTGRGLSIQRQAEVARKFNGLLAEVRRLRTENERQTALIKAHQQVELRFAREVRDLERQLAGLPEPTRRVRLADRKPATNV